MAEGPDLGTFETWLRLLKKSAYGGRAEVTGQRSIDAIDPFQSLLHSVPPHAPAPTCAGATELRRRSGVWL